MEAIVDLGSEQTITSVTTGFYQSNPSWIFLPSTVQYLISTDGQNFSNAVLVINDVSPKAEGLITKDFTGEFSNVKARYIKMVATSIGPCPDWHPAASSPSWLFADEIEVK